MNRVDLIGRLTRDPDITYKGENATASFSLAVDRPYAKEGKKNVDFIRCVAFGKKVQVFEKYITKGTQVAISGRISESSYTNKEGQKRYTTDVIVEQVYFIANKKYLKQELNAKYGYVDTDSAWYPQQQYPPQQQHSPQQQYLPQQQHSSQQQYPPQQ